MMIDPSIGFASTQSQASMIDVTLLAGVTTYSNTLYQGTPIYSPLSSINSTLLPLMINSTQPISSLLISSGAFVIISSPAAPHVVIYNSIPDMSQLPASAVGPNDSISSVGLPQSSICGGGGCSTGGICGIEGKCICSVGFTGTQCGEFESIRFQTITHDNRMQ